MLATPLESQRVDQLARALGCVAEIDAISLTLLGRTPLPQDECDAVRATVEHLVSHSGAWRAMALGVVPPAVRAQTLSAVVRSSETAPADMLVALLFATVRDVLRLPG